MTKFLLRACAAIVLAGTVGIAQTGTVYRVNTESRAISEADLLKAQLQTVKEYDQRLMSVVQWSLTVIVATLAVLVGYNWYTNHRELERERVALNEALARGLKDLEAKLNESLKVTVAAAEAKVRQSGKESVEALTEQVNARFLDQDITSTLLTAADWERQKVPINAVRYRLIALKKFGPNVVDGRVAHQLDKLKDQLKIVAPGHLDGSLAMQLTEYLGTLPPKFDVDKEVILELIRTLRK